MTKYGRKRVLASGEHYGENKDDFIVCGNRAFEWKFIAMSYSMESLIYSFDCAWSGGAWTGQRGERMLYQRGIHEDAGAAGPELVLVCNEEIARDK